MFRYSADLSSPIQYIRYNYFKFCEVVLKTPTKARSHITFLALGMNATAQPLMQMKIGNKI